MDYKRDKLTCLKQRKQTEIIPINKQNNQNIHQNIRLSYT